MKVTWEDLKQLGIKNEESLMKVKFKALMMNRKLKKNQNRNIIDLV